MSFRQDSEFQKVGQKPGVSVVVGVFDAIVLDNRGRVGLMDRKTVIHETVNEPVPVESGFNHATH